MLSDTGAALSDSSETKLRSAYSAKVSLFSFSAEAGGHNYSFAVRSWSLGQLFSQCAAALYFAALFVEHRYHASLTTAMGENKRSMMGKELEECK